MPATPSRVLDVGAGPGRAAAALAALGHTVGGVEPTPELRAHGQRLHPEAAITWIDDSLPDLGKVHARGERFDLIMLTAVWMHLDSDQREHAMAGIVDLLLPGALVTLLLRHGPVPAGRRMFDVSAAETRAMADHHGLKNIPDHARPRPLGGRRGWC